MSFLSSILEPPSYGFARPDGSLSSPTRTEILREFFSRLNFLRDRRNWLPAFGWFTSALFLVPLYFFITRHFSWGLAALGFVYSMVALGSFGTVWFHRYGTHRAFQFSHPFWRFLFRNAMIKIIPDEVYVVSHHVHHKFSEQPGDPYNVHGGWLYCFLADVNHQLVARNLSEKDYARVAGMVQHMGVNLNSYEQYVKWGSICHPAWTLLHYVLNWTFWYGAFYLVGGHALATALFGAAGFWAFGVRTYNYDGHGGGKDKRRDGIDFNREDLSINQVWPGYVAGEWHNNHHLYPNGARSGFLPYQLDIPWIVIRTANRLGMISSYRDYKEDFLAKHYRPYLETKKSRDRPIGISFEPPKPPVNPRPAEQARASRLLPEPDPGTVHPQP